MTSEFSNFLVGESPSPLYETLLEVASGLSRVGST